MSKKDETREETLERLARDAHEGRTAVKRFETLVKRVIKTPKSEVDRRAAEWREARKPTSSKG